MRPEASVIPISSLNTKAVISDGLGLLSALAESLTCPAASLGEISCFLAVRATPPTGAVLVNVSWQHG